MKKPSRVKLCLLFITIFHLFTPVLQEAMAETYLIEKILVRVGDELITLTDVKAFTFLHPEFKEEDINFPSKELMTEVIKNRLLYIEANKIYKIDDHAALKVKEDEMITKYSGEDEYIRSLSEMNIDSDIIIEEIKREILVELYTEKRIKPFIFVSPNEIEDYYRKHQDIFFEELSTVKRKIKKIIEAEKYQRRVDQTLAKILTKTDIVMLEGY